MDDLKTKYENLKPDSSEDKIEKTVESLVRRQYMPFLILEVKDFFHMTRERMQGEYKRVMALSPDSEELKNVVGIDDAEDVKTKHLTALLNQYTLLCGLRENSPESWDTVNELYEDD
ncbi:MAG: hypothetical protein WCS04_05525 [Sphaerochaetaceae bacterium]